MTAQSTAILGGGALGLTLAWRLAQAGERVVVYERETEAGGLAAGFRVGEHGPWLEKFYHHLFATDSDAIALIGELGLGEKLTWRAPNSSMLIGGKPYRLDSDPRSILSLSPLPLLDRLRLGAGGAILKFLPSPEPLAGSTAAAWLPRWMGQRAYQTIWKPMLVGKFGERADDIAMPWMWARAHYRTLRLGYLLGGSILIETVFSWPGTGFLLNSAIFQRDLPLLQGTILVLALFFVLLNLLVDVLQTLLDPRIARS